MKFQDLTGQRFSRLTVVSFDGIKKKHTMWNCLCVCGNQCLVDGSSLRESHTKSCGCYQQEQRHKANRIHGQCKSRAFKSWTEMLQRCDNPNNKRFSGYGGRGIAVCHRWIKFENFLNDMGDRPAGMSLERKNNDGNYEPSNCKWGTPTEQANNKRTSRFFSHDGKRLTVAQWAKHSNQPYVRLHQRLIRYGWDIERALC